MQRFGMHSLHQLGLMGRLLSLQRRQILVSHERSRVGGCSRRGREKKQKINVISGWAHSHTRLACVDEGGLIINTRDFASKLQVDKAAQTIMVDAGVIFRDLLNEAAKAGLAFPTSTSWDGVSAAGSMSTGAHGSGLVGKGSAINEYVVGLRLVVPAPASQGYAKVIEHTKADEDLKPARFSLGTLGAISYITFALITCY